MAKLRAQEEGRREEEEEGEEKGETINGVKMEFDNDYYTNKKKSLSQLNENGSLLLAADLCEQENNKQKQQEIRRICAVKESTMLMFAARLSLISAIFLIINLPEPSKSQISQQQQQQPLNFTSNQTLTTIKPPNYIETGRQITGILDRFMSLGYDKRVRPNYGGPPVEVTVTMRILSISSVSEVMMDFTADFYFRQTWHDPRLSFKKLGDIQTLYVGAEVSKKIWLPDTFFGNEKLAYFHEATTPNVFLRIDHSGEVYRSIRLTVTSSCPMNLQYFPMDRQRCTIEAESYGYNVKDIIYRWAKSTAVERDDQISLPQFDIVKTVQKYRLEELSSGTYSRLIAEIHFARRMGYYLIQIYIPSSLIVVISWVSFWLHRNASPARVQLGVTTVLTMTTLMSSTNAALPKISYVKSIDIFLGTCFIMVFAALLEYATVGYLGKRIAMRKAQMQHAHSQAQSRLLAQLQAQGAQGNSVPPVSSMSVNTVAAAAAAAAAAAGDHHPSGISPLGAASGFVTGQTTSQTNWMDELTAMAAAAAASDPTAAADEVNPLASILVAPPPPTSTASTNCRNQLDQIPPQVPARHCSHVCHMQQHKIPSSSNYPTHAHHQQTSCCPPQPQNQCRCQQHQSNRVGRNNCRSNCNYNCNHNNYCLLNDQSIETHHPHEHDYRGHEHHHAGCSQQLSSNTSRTLPRNLTFAADDRLLHSHNNDQYSADKLHQAMWAASNNGGNSPNTLNRPLLSATSTAAAAAGPEVQTNTNLPPSYGSKGASAAAAAAAAAFVNLHRRNKGLPPSTNPNFAQFAWMGQQNRSLETIFGIRPSDIDKYSRVVFPVCFVCFQLMYWIVYLHISAFLESEQQQQPH